jgi:hypothetical protein
MYPEILNIIIFSRCRCIVREIVRSETNEHFPWSDSKLNEHLDSISHRFKGKSSRRNHEEDKPFETMSSRKNMLIRDKSAATIVGPVFADQSRHPNPRIRIRLFAAHDTSVVRQTAQFRRFVQRSLRGRRRIRCDHHVRLFTVHIIFSAHRRSRRRSSGDNSIRYALRLS